MNEFLIRKRPSKLQRSGKRKMVAHLWDGSDTLCRLWSTGGIRRKTSYKVADAPGKAEICMMCAENASPHLDRLWRAAVEAERDPAERQRLAERGSLQVGMDEAKGERAVPPLSAPLGIIAVKRYKPERVKRYPYLGEWVRYKDVQPALVGAEEHTHVHRDGSATVTRRAAGSIEEVFIRHIEARKPGEAPSWEEAKAAFEIIKAHPEEAAEAMKTLGSDLCACGHERQEHAYGIGCPRQPEGAFRPAEEAQLQIDALEAVLAMAVARLGGEVEGAPTHRINFLQRIDALRALEAGAVRNRTSPPPVPGYDEVLEGLRGVRAGLYDLFEMMSVQGWENAQPRLDAAIAFLESLPESVKWSEMPGDTAFRCTECDWHGTYQDLRISGCPDECPECGEQIEPL